MAFGAIFASALLIAIADSLVKKMSVTGGFIAAATNPWMIAVCILYFIQILLAVYVFINHGEFAVYADVYIIFYSILTVMAGIFIFKEHLTLLQSLGVIFTLIGAILINH